MKDKLRAKLLAWRKRAAEVVRAINGQMPNLLVLSGAAAMSVGIGLIYRPAGVIAAGVFLAVIGIFMMTGGDSH